MSSLDPTLLHILDGAVKAIVQERKKHPSGSQLVDRILERVPFLSREFLEQHKEIVLECWMTHFSALDDTETPPSPPDSAKNVGHRGSNGSSSMEGSGSEDRLIIPAEDPEKTHRVSISIHLEKTNLWKGMRGLYGMRKETFISQKIVDRYNLPIEDKKVHLTWLLGDESKSYNTCFLVVSDDQLASDCLLGTHCQKSDEENEEQHDDDDERNSEGSQPRSETFMDSSLCRIPTKIIPVQEQVGVATTLAHMNADSLFRYNQHLSGQVPQLLENSGYNLTNGQPS